jgi:hypothetical protein
MAVDWFWATVAECEVGFFDVTAFKGHAQFALGLSGQANQDNAGGFTVDAIHETGVFWVSALLFEVILQLP